MGLVTYLATAATFVFAALVLPWHWLVQEPREPCEIKKLDGSHHGLMVSWSPDGLYSVKDNDGHIRGWIKVEGDGQKCTFALLKRRLQ